MSLYDSGIRPAIDAHLTKLAEEKRDYGKYWSASSAGYCYRRLIFERLNIPYVTEDARKQRIFSSGDIFHEWIQGITMEAGLSIAQELELQDTDMMIRGHIDDLVLVTEPGVYEEDGMAVKDEKQHLILYDYKTAHSKWFEYAKTRPVSYYNKMQVGTYMYMVRKVAGLDDLNLPIDFDSWSESRVETWADMLTNLSEARILKISKDDLRLFEYQVLWTPELEEEVYGYWNLLNENWQNYLGDLAPPGTLPPCTCHEHENGFLAKEAWNPWYYEGEPCSELWFREQLKQREKVK